MTYVYVVGRGERGEGQEPVAVAVTLRQAKRVVFDRFDTEVERAGQGRWVASFNGGVDEIWIHRLALIGAS